MSSGPCRGADEWEDGWEQWENFFTTGTHEHHWEIFLATGTHWGHLGNVALEVLCLHVGSFWLKFGQNHDSLCKGRKIVPDTQFLHLLQHKGKVVIINPDIG